MTKITIDLDAEEVAWLRSDRGSTGAGTPLGRIFLKLHDELPPPPIQLRIELSPDVVANWEQHFQTYAYTPGADVTGLSAGEAEALNAVRSAIKDWVLEP